MCPADSSTVSSIVVSDLEYAPPGADSLFFDVSTSVSAPGEHAALVGANGVGKSTILRILVRRARGRRG
jgi:ATPase subunit of ABC transporter with duplicated ATPase domains